MKGIGRNPNEGNWPTSFRIYFFFLNTQHNGEINPKDIATHTKPNDSRMNKRKTQRIQPREAQPNGRTRQP